MSSNSHLHIIHHLLGSRHLKHRWIDSCLVGRNVTQLFKFKIKSHLIDKTQLNYQSMVTLKHWHKLPLVENQIAPAISVVVFVAGGTVPVAVRAVLLTGGCVPVAC